MNKVGASPKPMAHRRKLLFLVFTVHTKTQILQHFLSARTVLALKHLNHQEHSLCLSNSKSIFAMFVIGFIPCHWLHVSESWEETLLEEKLWNILKTWWIQCSQTCHSWLGPPCTFHLLRHPWTWPKNSAKIVSSDFFNDKSVSKKLKNFPLFVCD